MGIWNWVTSQEWREAARFVYHALPALALSAITFWFAAKSLKEAELSRIEQFRPILAFSLEEHSHGIGDGKIKLKLFVKNLGLSPAIDIEFKLWIGVGSLHGSNAPNIASDDSYSLRLRIGTLSHNQTYVVDAVIAKNAIRDRYGLWISDPSITAHYFSATTSVRYSVKHHLAAAVFAELLVEHPRTGGATDSLTYTKLLGELGEAMHPHGEDFADIFESLKIGYLPPEQDDSG